MRPRPGNSCRWFLIPESRDPAGYTTVMLRNIPNKYTREMLVKQLNQVNHVEAKDPRKIHEKLVNTKVRPLLPNVINGELCYYENKPYKWPKIIHGFHWDEKTLRKNGLYNNI